jgi:hypothetical protein
MSTKLALPSHVYPLGIPFQVQVVDVIDEDAEEGEDDDGSTELTKRIIKIHSAQDTRRRWTTLLHEYMHATLNIVGAVGGPGIIEFAEEVIVQSLEHSLEQFLLAHGKEMLKALEVQR